MRRSTDYGYSRGQKASGQRYDWYSGGRHGYTPQRIHRAGGSSDITVDPSIHEFLEFLISKPDNAILSDVPVSIDPSSEDATIFQDLKKDLNEAKDLLDPLSEGDNTDFYKFMRTIDIFIPMKRKIEALSNAYPMSNAWIKYWELFKRMGLIKPTQGVYRAFFNAELPGSSLCAFVHLMKTEYPDTPFDWYASSISAEDSDRLGDDYGLYARNSDKWLMTIPPKEGQNDGDSTKLANLLDCEARLGPNSPVGGMSFYSHDAGINVDIDASTGKPGYNHQEALNAKIHLGCALAGFMTLKNGGNFIAKQYTFFEPFTWHLILIYSSLFDEFWVCKPQTSRPYNSEIYLVGKGFRGLDERTRKILIDRLENFNMDGFLTGTSLCTEMLKSASFIFKRQAELLRAYSDMYKSLVSRYGRIPFRELQAAYDDKKDNAERMWLNAYPVLKIRTQDRITSNPPKFYYRR